MSHLLSGLFKFVRGKLLLFGFIVLILMSMNWVKNEWGNIQRIREELPSLQQSKKDVDDYRVMLADAISSKARQLSNGTAEQFDERILSLDNEISRLQKEQENEPALSVVAKGMHAVPEQLTNAVKRSLTMEMLRQERDYVSSMREFVKTLGNRKEEERKLTLLEQEQLATESALQNKLKQQAAFEANAGLMVRIPFTDANEQQKKLNQQVTALREANGVARRAFLTQQARLGRLPALSIPAEFKIDETRIAAILHPLQGQVVRAENLAAQSYAWQAYQVVQPWLAMAFAIVLGWVLLMALSRTLFYFVLAPLAARRPPIVLTPLEQSEHEADSTGQAGQASNSVISAVSKTVKLVPGCELLLRPDYCQSQPENVSASTKLLFDWSRWLTSIAANLWMLKRMHATEEVEIVVSSTTSTLDEVALLDIADGKAFVIHPRGLVGMMYKTGQRTQIRSHWRIASLHAWLTLQLRYLSFDGPVTLIVKGISLYTSPTCRLRPTQKKLMCLCEGGL